MIHPEFLIELPDFANHNALRGFFAAWHRWRGEAIAPKRSQIKLNDMHELMRGTMLLDAIAPETLMFRYTGSIYQDMYKFDFTGLNYLDITEKSVRPLRSKRLWAIVDQPCAAVWTAPGADGVDFIGASVPILPDDPDHPAKIMQVLVPLRDMHHISTESWQVPRDKVIFSDHFRYVDIGAGKPDTSVES